MGSVSIWTRNAHPCGRTAQKSPAGAAFRSVRHKSRRKILLSGALRCGGALTMTDTKLLGRWGEELAAEHLKSRGYKITGLNYRCRMGEIDLIAQSRRYLVFCEVKYRTDRRKGMPSEAVHIRKQQVISRCALYYMTVNGVWGCPCRFDVVGILGEAGDEIRLYRNAFDYKG